MLLTAYVMIKRLKNILLLFITLLLLCLGVTIIMVEYWRHTEAGKVPAKTAVLLHAVNKDLVTSDMKPPKIFIRSGVSGFSRETRTIKMSDGGEIPIRIYEPKTKGPHPILLYYHGGAFLEGYGNINTHDNIVRALASKTQSVVISVGYRVAPDYPFPTATKDSYESLVWAVKNASLFNGDPGKLAVAGDSAGGNIAAVVAQMSRDLRGPKIAAQVLLYPLTTFKDVEFPSRKTYDSGYYLISRSVMLKARKYYTPMEEMWNDPYTSPLEADDLDNLPPAIVITAEFDPLRDEGEAYSKRLVKHDIPVKAIRYKGVMHGFISFYEVMYSGNHALDETAAFLSNVYQDRFQSTNYTLDIYDAPPTLAALRERGEAYAIGGFLIGKQALSIFSSTK